MKGFAPGGNILVDVTPQLSEGTDSAPGCLPKRGPWLLNWDRGALKPMASGISVRTYGKWRPQPTDHGSERKK